MFGAQNAKNLQDFWRFWRQTFFEVLTNFYLWKKLMFKLLWYVTLIIFFKHMYNLFIYNYSHYCTTFNIVMILSPCIEVKTFSPSIIIYTYILIVIQINKVLFY